VSRDAAPDLARRNSERSDQVGPGACLDQKQPLDGAAKLYDVEVLLALAANVPKPRMAFGRPGFMVNPCVRPTMFSR